MRPRAVTTWLCALGLAAAGVIPAPAKETAAPIDALAWLAGHWRGELRTVVREEWWTAPAGGVMLGLHRDVRAGRQASFEFLRIAETPEGLTLYASPGGKAATPFTAVEIGSRRVVFENVLHDFPQHVMYEISVSGDTLVASIKGRTKDEGRWTSWTWLRVEGSRR